MRDIFSDYHPFINLVYFLAVIAFSMFFMHPVFLALSCICSFIYSVKLKGKKAVKFNIVGMVPMAVIVALMNAVFNNNGATALFILPWGKAFTLQSLIYGLFTGLMLVSVIIWFSCYNIVMTSDKFIFLFGKLIPSVSLILSMVLRFVPNFVNQVKAISTAQRCIGRDVSHGKLMEKAGHGVKLISVLTTWSLENAIISADSMRSRGYDLKGRTSFSIYKWSFRDKVVLVLLLACIGLVFFGVSQGGNSFSGYPRIVVGELTPARLTGYLAYGFLCLVPVLVAVYDEIHWRIHL